MFIVGGLRSKGPSPGGDASAVAAATFQAPCSASITSAFSGWSTSGSRRHLAVAGVVDRFGQGPARDMMPLHCPKRAIQPVVIVWAMSYGLVAPRPPWGSPTSHASAPSTSTSEDALERFCPSFFFRPGNCQRVGAGHHRECAARGKAGSPLIGLGRASGKPSHIGADMNHYVARQASTCRHRPARRRGGIGTHIRAAQPLRHGHARGLRVPVFWATGLFGGVSYVFCAVTKGAHGRTSQVIWFISRGRAPHFVIG